MNILSISQVQTQTSQADFTQTAPSGTQEIKASSFADFLRDARQTSESEKTAQNEKSDVSENDSPKLEKVASKAEEKNPAEEKKIDSPVEEKSEKVAQKNFSDKKSEEVNENPAEKNVDENQILLAGLNQLKNAENLTAEDSGLEVEETKIVLGEENAPIDDKTLAWLMTQSKSADIGDEMSSEDFASMIDAAIEFIPGNESEEEKLANAQTLSSSDPKMFLENIENNLVQPEVIKENQKNLAPTDKKLASLKEKKNDVKLSVHDLRTKHLFEDNSAKVDGSKTVQKAAEKKEINLSIHQQNENNVQMTMELANLAQQNITSSSSQAAAASGSDFQQMLSNAVQENAPDFVKAGNIILKDNNQGSINLILRPEGLGNVKISLNLDDKNLSAQISVQTKEAMNAFKESIPALKQAFAESGFETGSFDLNFSNNDSGFAQGGDSQQNQQKNAGILAHKSYGEFVTADALSSEDRGQPYSGGDYSVNIVA
ncbi:MAG: flagellar hook-length control protein FliK [Treponema sp.]|nr:flagellar hook-length control protein FliK [Treponema sp.]